jgi:hypothetical protein
MRRRTATVGRVWPRLLLAATLGWTAQAPAAETPPAALPEFAALISPETQLNDPENDPAWRGVLARLAPSRTRQSSFEERRTFPFRREPVVLKGEVRVVPELGLSLRYLEPEERTVIIDAKGLVVRDPDGRERAMPSDNRAQAATAALGNILRFNLTALRKDFVIHGRQEGQSWTLAFVPRDPALTNSLGVIVVRGDEANLRRVEMVKSATQRIAVTIYDTKENVLFDGYTLQRFFR